MKTIEVFKTIGDLWLRFRGLVKRRKVVTSFFLLLVLGLICTTPIRNPSPKEKITINGVFPYDKGFELEFYQYAYSTADWYSYVCSGFGLIRGKSTCTASREVLYPERIDDQHYELTVYRDRYFKGFVGWTAAHSFFRAYKKNAPENTIFSIPEANLISMRCDGNGRRLSQRAGQIFCTTDENRHEYKYLVLTEDLSFGFSEHLNFWLYTE